MKDPVSNYRPYYKSVYGSKVIRGGAAKSKQTLWPTALYREPLGPQHGYSAAGFRIVRNR